MNRMRPEALRPFVHRFRIRGGSVMSAAPVVLPGRSTVRTVRTHCNTRIWKYWQGNPKMLHITEIVSACLLLAVLACNSAAMQVELFVDPRFGSD